MPYTNSPATSVTDRLRLIIGDTDLADEQLTDDIYTFYLSRHENNENKAALSCLDVIIAKYSHYATEKGGGVFVKAEEKFKNLSILRKRLAGDPSYGLVRLQEGYVGGVNCDDIREIESDPNRIKLKIREDGLLPGSLGD